MREQIYRDHISDLAVKSDKMKGKTHYGENFGWNFFFELPQREKNFFFLPSLFLYLLVFSDEMQNNCDNQNFDYHLRKNDLKWYSEAYIRQKGMMRKQKKNLMSFKTYAIKNMMLLI